MTAFSFYLFRLSFYYLLPYDFVLLLFWLLLFRSFYISFRFESINLQETCTFFIDCPLIWFCAHLTKPITDYYEFICKCCQHYVMTCAMKHVEYFNISFGFCIDIRRNVWCDKFYSEIVFHYSFTFHRLMKLSICLLQNKYYCLFAD